MKDKATENLSNWNFSACPVRNVLARVGDKWSLLTLHALTTHGTLRFTALQRAIPDVSTKMLSATLQRLQEDGFVTRQVYAAVPPRVDYTITALGTSFMAACSPVLQWATDHLAAILHDREANRREADGVDSYARAPH